MIPEFTNVDTSNGSLLKSLLNQVLQNPNQLMIGNVNI